MPSAADCLSRFTLAVRDGKKGNYGKAAELVEAVRKKFGDGAAAICKKEVWAAIQSDRWNGR